MVFDTPTAARAAPPMAHNAPPAKTVSLQKRGILVEIKACEKFYRRHMVDIPRIKF
jgi:hypothetical protein